MRHVTFFFWGPESFCFFGPGVKKFTICPKTLALQHLILLKINFGHRNVMITSPKSSWNYSWAP